jgi:hypothetical protein
LTINPFGQLGSGVDGVEGVAVAKGKPEDKRREEVGSLRLEMSLRSIANSGNKLHRCRKWLPRVEPMRQVAMTVISFIFSSSLSNEIALADGG